MNTPPQKTADIFNLLNKGRFISSNTINPEERVLFKVIEDNFDDLYDYFLHIDIYLEAGDEFFYFSRDDKRVDIENKLKRMLRYIDILDFFKGFDTLFSSGYRFSSSAIAEKCRVDSNLQRKLDAINSSSGTDKIQKKIEDIIVEFEKLSYFVLENEIEGTYKVLSSFKYLEEIVNKIEIAGDDDETA